MTLDGDSLITYYLDLLVEQEVIVELKALSHPVSNNDIAQVTDYLAATSYPVALLINFGRTRLEYRRILPPNKIAMPRSAMLPLAENVGIHIALEPSLPATSTAAGLSPPTS